MILQEINYPFKLRRVQFPIKLAYAITFNRAQGQSLHKCGILLPAHVWTHGQLYVALYRCGNPNNVFITADQKAFKNKDFPCGINYMKNVVYPEISPAL